MIVDHGKIMILLTLHNNNLSYRRHFCGLITLLVLVAIIFSQYSNR